MANLKNKFYYFTFILIIIILLFSFISLNYANTNNNNDIKAVNYTAQNYNVNILLSAIPILNENYQNKTYNANLIGFRSANQNYNLIINGLTNNYYNQIPVTSGFYGIYNDSVSFGNFSMPNGTYSLKLTVTSAIELTSFSVSPFLITNNNGFNISLINTDNYITVSGNSISYNIPYNYNIFPVKNYNLTFNVNTDNYNVIINGVNHGTIKTIELTNNEYNISISQNGYYTYYKTLNLENNTTLYITLNSLGIPNYLLPYNNFFENYFKINIYVFFEFLIILLGAISGVLMYKLSNTPVLTLIPLLSYSIIFYALNFITLAYLIFDIVIFISSIVLFNKGMMVKTDLGGNNEL